MGSGTSNTVGGDRLVYWLYFLPPFAPLVRDAAALACVCVAAAAAYRGSAWRRAARIAPGGTVLEPATGTFDAVVAPGEPVQEAVDGCPPGGCVLLLPGTHSGPLVLTADKAVHVFGRGRATLRVVEGTALISDAGEGASVDGILLRSMGGRGPGDALHISGGALRVQACDCCAASKGGSVCVRIAGGAPTLVGCRVHDSRHVGVWASGASARGRLVGCEVYGNAAGGVFMVGGASLQIVCTVIRDHPPGLSSVACGVGVYVHASSRGLGEVAGDNVFERNARADVFRE